jgi:hypothetical protein
MLKQHDHVLVWLLERLWEAALFRTTSLSSCMGCNGVAPHSMLQGSLLVCLAASCTQAQHSRCGPHCQSIKTPQTAESRARLLHHLIALLFGGPVVMLGLTCLQLTVTSDAWVVCWPQLLCQPTLLLLILLLFMAPLLTCNFSLTPSPS